MFNIIHFLLRLSMTSLQFIRRWKLVSFFRHLFSRFEREIWGSGKLCVHTCCIILHIAGEDLAVMWKF
jgi:hypothetical protein